MKKSSSVVFLHENSAQDTALCGGKGASLAQMTARGINVPPGFVVTTLSYDLHLKTTSLEKEIEKLLKTIKKEDLKSVENISKKIQSLLRKTILIPELEKDIYQAFDILNTTFVAVRSSATAEDSKEAAWAGQLESYLNVTKKDLLEKIRECWASLFSPRALVYRLKQYGNESKISLGVVVQKMVQSEVSGIAFSVHPVTQNKDHILIEASFGLGEAIVGGAVTPDQYIVDKRTSDILQKNIVSKEKGLFKTNIGSTKWKNIEKKKREAPALKDEEIKELQTQILTIENYFGFPCDIEWAYENHTCYIVQSRPITTLDEDRVTTPQQNFVKVYTRNFSITMQEAWFHGHKNLLLEKLELKEYPYTPPYVYFMQDGVEEVWQNTKFDHWFQEKLFEKISSDPSFFPKIYKTYHEQLEKIKKWWKKDMATKAELKIFIEKVDESVGNFVILYGVLFDEKISQEYKELSIQFRKEDVFWAECNTAIMRAWKNISPELGYLVVYITKDEIDKKISKQELQKRDKGFALIPGIFQKNIDFQSFTQHFPEYSFQEERLNENETQLQGQVAFQGKVKGSIRIVKRLDQAQKVKTGEIIVSPMTTPDFVPALQKAAGIITDEGGVTCHAAIIARELKKPCIIGTKTATKVLQDGDQVEVDAYEGKVYIFKPAVYEKVFARDFSFIALEIAALSECKEDKPWVEGKKNPHTPYLLIERAQGTSHIWYNTKGLRWTLETLKNHIFTHKNFLKTLPNHIEKKIEFIRPIYEKQKPVDKETLLKFIQNFLDAYPWIEAMWWIKDMEFENFEKEKIQILKLRKATEILSAATDIVIRTSLEKLYPQLGILSSMIRSEELKNDSIPTSTILHKRLKGFTMIDGKLLMKDLQSIARQEKYELNFEKIDKNVSSFTGQTAYQGNIIGKICKVMGHMDFGKIKTGEILVSPMTMIDFLPEMQKASAFITDEGGITCHAAIVAREMKKPCIIGTKIATQILEEGDLVELDTQEGRVIILQKNT